MQSRYIRNPRAALKRSAAKACRAIVETLENRLLLSSTPDLGINIRRLGADSGDELFADAMKEAGPWSTNLTTPSSSALAAVDASGWPTSDAGIQVVNTLSDNGGTYALSFTGQATVAAIPAEPGVQVTGASYNSSSNTTTADVVVPAGQTVLELDFTNTKRLTASASGTGVTNVQLMRPNGVDSSVSYSPSTLFSTPILNLISNFSTIRYKDFSAIDNSVSTNWSDRVLPNQPQTRALGGAWEYAVALSNQTGKGMWIDIPELASNAYITNLANLIDYGSDGVNPYTGPVGSAVTAANPNPVPASGPVWAGINPNLPVYVEYSNEVWNTIFSAYGQNLQATIAEVNAGGSALNYDGDGSQADWAVRRNAERTLETSNIFRQVFGDNRMMSEVRPVLSWQYGNFNDTASVALEYLNNYYDNADGMQHVANPQPVNYYLYGAGGGWYGGLSNPNGVGNVIIPGAGFSAPTVSGYKADPSGSTWTFTGTAGIAANGSTLKNPASTNGTQAAYLQGSGSFTEKVTFTGGLADLTFSDATTGTESVAVYVDGVRLGGPSTPGSAYGGQRTAVFNSGAAGSIHTITFTGTSGTGTAFVSNVVAETVNGMYNSTIQDISPTIQIESTWAKAFGLHMVGYEGGLNFGTGSTGTPLQIDANQDPRAEAIDIAQMDEFYASGGELGMYFDTTNAIWALTLDINNQTTPKILAVKSVVAAPTPAINFGGQLPTVAGQSITVANLDAINADAGGLYPLYASAPGTYTVSLTGMQSGAEVEQFILDGQVIPGLTSLPTTTSGNSTPALTFTITTPGLHALLMNLIGSGTVTPVNPAGPIVVTAGAGPALPALPSAPTNLVATPNGLTETDLAWTSAPGADGYQINRSTDGVHFEVYGYTTNTSSYADTTSAPGSTYTYMIVPYNAGGFGAGVTAAPVTTPSSNVPVPWSDADVGMPFIGGYADFASATGTWTVAGGGTDIWNDSDQFNFLSQPISGDGTIIARVASLTSTTPGAKAGVMFRASSDPTSLFVDVVVQAGGTLTMQYRSTASQTPMVAASTAGVIAAPEWVKLVRSGNTFTGSYSSDGMAWTTLGMVSSLVLPTTAAAGLAVTAHNDALRGTATFTNVSATSAAGITTGAVSGSVTTSGAAGVAGVTVYIDSNGDFQLDNGELSAITNSAGVYMIGNVPAGPQVIRQVLPAGAMQTSPSGGLGIAVTVTVNATLSNQNFVDAVTAGVSGAVTTSTGAGILGITIYLDTNNNGKLDSNELSTTTDANGAYSFVSVPSGATIIRQILPAGDTQTSPASGFGIHITVASDTLISNQNFIDTVPVLPTTGVVSGFVTTGGAVGIAGITVYIDIDDSNTFNAGDLSAVTDSTGAYTIANVPAGAQVIRQVLPMGDTQITPAGGFGIPVTVIAGGSLSNENFTDMVTGSVSGSVKTDTGAPLSGITVYVDSISNGMFDNGELFAMTDSTGAYVIANIPAGPQTIRQVLPTGAAQTNPAAGLGIQVTVGAGVLSNQNFTDTFTGSVTGTVMSTSGAGLAGVTVYVDSTGNGMLDSGELSATTNSAGVYMINNVPAGAQVIRQVVPAGDTQTTPATGLGIQVTVVAGVTLANENFIDTVPVVIGGSVSGSIKTSGGTGVAGVTVYLDSNNSGKLDNGELSTVTAATGLYSFANVPVGATIIRQILPAGDTQTTPTGGAGISITVPAGGSLINENFIDTVPTTSKNGSVSGSVKTSKGVGVAGVKVYLDTNNNGKLDSGELSTTTSSTGTYSFSSVPAGATIIRLILPSGDKQTTPSGGLGIHITVKAGVALTNENFIVTVPTTSTTAVSNTSLDSGVSAATASLLDVGTSPELTNLVSLPLATLVKAHL